MGGSWHIDGNSVIILCLSSYKRKGSLVNNVHEQGLGDLGSFMVESEQFISLPQFSVYKGCQFSTSEGCCNPWFAKAL